MGPTMISIDTAERRRLFAAAVGGPSGCRVEGNFLMLMDAATLEFETSRLRAFVRGDVERPEACDRPTARATWQPVALTRTRTPAPPPAPPPSPASRP
jgi:hypothetical protein